MHSHVTQRPCFLRLHLDRCESGYYYLLVTTPTQRILNWLLITLMVMLPFRFVWADVESSCHMHDQPSEQTVGHHLHHSADVDQFDVVDLDDCCCCESGMYCSTDCGVSLSAGVILPSALIVPFINASSIRTKIVNDLVFREHIPPTRPPAYL